MQARFNRRSSRVFLGLAVALLALTSVPAAHATNGYFAHGYGTACKSMAGACAAMPQDTMTIATNPAGLSFVGKRYDVGLAWFSPDRKYTVEGGPSRFPGTFGLAPGTVESDSTSFVIPYFGANWEVGNGHNLGVALYGHGGLNTDYPAATFFDPQAPPTGVDLSQLFVAPTWSRQFGGGKHSLGISALFAYQTFEAQGVTSFAQFSLDPAKLSNNGKSTSTGWGFKLGYMGQWTEKFSFGISYQTEMNMGEFDDYRGLFAEAGGFDIPSTLIIGFGVKATPKLSFTADVQQIYYTDVKAVSNPFLPNLAQAPLGAPNGAGFGWNDMTIFKTGFQYDPGSSWIWRAGFSTGSQPIPGSEVLFNILAPGVMEQHLTFGLTKELGTSKAINFSLMYAPEVEVTGTNPLEVPTLQEITLAMNQWELEISYSWGF